MKSFTLKQSLLLLTLLAVTPLFQVQAASTGDDNDEIEFDCMPKGSATSKFKDLEILALEMNTVLCKSLLTVGGKAEDNAYLLSQFSVEAEAILVDRFNAAGLEPAINSQFNAFRAHIDTMTSTIADNDYPSLDATFKPAEVYFTDFTRSPIPNDSDPACKTISGPDGTMTFPSCSGALKDASNAFNNYKQAVTNVHVVNNQPKLDYLKSQWKRYLEKGRSQTLLDVWATSAAFDRYLSQDRLVGPPPAQLFLLRPQAVYEYNGDTQKGDRNQLGLAMEWAGFNFWDARIPWGVSAITVYADYEEEDSVGHGVQFTINNSFSIGWVDRGDTDGVFVTLDFLKVFEDKSSQLDRFKQDPFAWVRNDD
ncbi:hypothetical protein [Vibrio sp. DNB22_19_1]